MDPLFLSLDEILSLHDDQIRRYGGTGGVRDLGLLQSAIGTVSATFDGSFLHETAFEMAAAYLSEDELYDLIMGVVAKRVTKADVAVFFQQHAR